MKVSMKMISELDHCDNFDELLDKLDKTADDEEMLEASSLAELAGVDDTLWVMGEMKMKSQIVEFAEGCAERAKEYTADATSVTTYYAADAARYADDAAAYAASCAAEVAARAAACATLADAHYAAEYNKQIQHLKELLK